MWNIISKCYLPILLYEVASLSLQVDQVHELSVALNLVFRRCSHMARNVRVSAYIVYYILLELSMPMNMILDKRKVRLV